MEIINGGVTAAKGFKANGLYCGIKKPAVDDPSIKHKNDIGLLVCDVPCATAAVYTQNKVKGAPILVTKKNLEATGGMAKAVIVNSKNANTCNADGLDIANAMCQSAAQALGIREEDIVRLNEPADAAGYPAPSGTVASLTRGKVQEKSACSACYASLVRALYLAKRSGIKVTKPIFIGQEWKGQAMDGIGVGACCAGASCPVKGCPPTAGAVLEVLRKG